jgi:hypothetical protein
MKLTEKFTERTLKFFGVFALRLQKVIDDARNFLRDLLALRCQFASFVSKRNQLAARVEWVGCFGNIFNFS